MFVSIINFLSAEEEVCRPCCPEGDASEAHQEGNRIGPPELACANLKGDDSLMLQYYYYTISKHICNYPTQKFSPCVVQSTLPKSNLLGLKK